VVRRGETEREREEGRAGGPESGSEENDRSLEGLSKPSESGAQWAISS